MTSTSDGNMKTIQCYISSVLRKTQNKKGEIPNVKKILNHVDVANQIATRTLLLSKLYLLHCYENKLNFPDLDSKYFMMIMNQVL